MGFFGSPTADQIKESIMLLNMDAEMKRSLRKAVDKLDSLTAISAALTGAVTGNITGDVTGNVAGNLVGEHTALKVGVSSPTQDGAADMTKTLFLPASGVDLTGFTPAVAGQIAVIWCNDSTTDVTVTCGTGCTFNGTNNKATFEDAGDALVLIAMSTTRWLVLVNLGSVAFSTQA